MSNQPPRFSVIIPTFNRIDLLKETIASINRQAYQSYEVIVVDDGSTDGTIAWLAENEPSIPIVRQDRQGPGAARNAGARIARGAYLAFLDSDDLWLPWTLQAYDRIIFEVGNPAFVAGRQHLFEGSSSDVCSSDLIQPLSQHDSKNSKCSAFEITSRRRMLGDGGELPLL